MSDLTPGKKLVALTGATGFVGSHILEQLIRSGFNVRLLARDPARLTHQDGTVEIVPGSLDDTEALQRLVADASAIIHCAGLISGVTRTQFDAVNATAAGACARAAREAGVDRFLLVSSLAAREPQLSAYAASKRGGEDAVRAEAGQMGVTVIRPPAVYGPGDREMLVLFRLMGRGLAPVFGAPDARFSLIYVEDLAEAALAWLTSGRSVPNILELDDGQPGGYGWEDVCDAVSSITGRRVKQLRLPGGILTLPAALNTAAGILTGYDPMLSLGKLRELRHPDWVSQTSDSPGIPGWQPRHRLVEGLLKTPGWRD
jgi:nucleoside-diphosphate-sugar epimerase